jgi:hypothetical protein
MYRNIVCTNISCDVGLTKAMLLPDCAVLYVFRIGIVNGIYAWNGDVLFAVGDVRNVAQLALRREFVENVYVP